MPAERHDGRSESPLLLTRLPFPPVTKSHIIHCSYANWYALYRPITPKARIIPLTIPFLDYLREDGIILPDDDDETGTQPTWSDQDSGIFSEDRSNASDEEEEVTDPAQNFRDVHLQIKQTIAELGGNVSPKLNWSAPKDATWIAATNSMECRSPSDIYLLLKSSDFVTHDLEQAFDDCVDDMDDVREGDGTSTQDDSGSAEPAEPARAPRSLDDIHYTLVLRKWIELNPSVEFRCFVRSRRLVAMCQRDLNHFAFLFAMTDQIRSRIQAFFDEHLERTFPDENFVFDVYIPPPHKRVWLIDINPWAPRTDPLLFSWLEILRLVIPPSGEGDDDATSASDQDEEERADEDEDEDDNDEDEVESREVEIRESKFVPELRLVKKDDPEAYSFNTPQFSAHKLPKDVVDASSAGPGPLREFTDQWKDLLAKQAKDDGDEDEDEEGGVDE
ncbi:MAG: hypothetical protein M1837_002521 [Sclerophora amabilis]|nr:MAG: hypothetical protein M1837_002521 [Sclerophora amabilis]